MVNVDVLLEEGLERTRAQLVQAFGLSDGLEVVAGHVRNDSVLNRNIAYGQG